MARWAMAVILIMAAGCAGLGKQDILSRNLPLTLADIDEIRTGDDQHRMMFDMQTPPGYKLYTSPELQAYVANIGMKLARASKRPNLPYQFFIVDSDEVDVFGMGGGRIYLTRGFFFFVKSESELAGAIAHEIGHIVNFRYALQEPGKVRKGYDLLLKGSEQGSGLGGHFGSAAHTGIKALGYIGPKIKKRFSGDEEMAADKEAVVYLARVGYDPRAFSQLVERLSAIDVRDVSNFVDLLKSHPPMEQRRKALAARAENTHVQPKPRMEVKQDVLRMLSAPEEEVALSPGVQPLMEVAPAPAQADIPVVQTAALAAQ